MYIDTIETVHRYAKKGANAVLGMACDPYGNTNNHDLYVVHSKLFQAGKHAQFPNPANAKVEYLGFISRLNSKEDYNKLNVGADGSGARAFSAGSCGL